MAIGNDTSIGGSLAVTGDVSANQYLATSDARLKTNVRPLEPDVACRVLDDLRPVTFTWKNSGKHDAGFFAAPCSAR